VNAFLLLARVKFWKGRRHEQTSPLPRRRVSHREANQSRVVAPRAEHHMAFEAGELFAREPLQIVYETLDKHRFAFSD
jgi:hypothetical protein